VGEESISVSTLPRRVNSSCDNEINRRGLYYYGARYYEPATSRWISPDPAGFGLINPMGSDGEPLADGWPEGFGPGQSGGMRQGYSVIEALNWYSYVSNNPVKYVDPTGEIAATVLGAIIGGIGGATKGLVRELTDDQSGVNGGRIGVMAGIGIAKGVAVGLVVDATAAGVAATVGTGGGAAPAAVAGVIAAGAAGAAVVGFATGVAGSAGEQALYDGKVDMNTAIKEGAVDAAFSAGGAILAGTGKAAKATAGIYSRYARNTRSFAWGKAADNTQKVGRALSASSDAATGAGAGYGVIDSAVNNQDENK